MPSGITHILLTKEMLNAARARKWKKVLAASSDFLQLGAVAPDLPYSDAVQSPLSGKEEHKLADRFHYERTSDIPLKAFGMLRDWKHQGCDKQSVRDAFAFFVGYASHIVADGIVHPFVRDKVGDYAENAKEHRILEMKIDVLFYRRFIDPSGVKMANFNRSNLHDELSNLSLDRHPDLIRVMTLFTKLIQNVYGVRCEPLKFVEWTQTFHKLLDVAEGDHWHLYRSLAPIESFFYSDIEDIISKQDEILTLGTPKDRPENFLKKDRVDFFDDLVPRFHKMILPIVDRAYFCVFEGGEDLTFEDIPCIDLDTGRLVAENQLERIPQLWT